MLLIRCRSNRFASLPDSLPRTLCPPSTTSPLISPRLSFRPLHTLALPSQSSTSRHPLIAHCHLPSIAFRYYESSPPLQSPLTQLVSLLTATTTHSLTATHSLCRLDPISIFPSSLHLSLSSLVSIRLSIVQHNLLSLCLASLLASPRRPTSRDIFSPPFRLVDSPPPNWLSRSLWIHHWAFWLSVVVPHTSPRCAAPRLEALPLRLARCSSPPHLTPPASTRLDRASIVRTVALTCMM